MTNTHVDQAIAGSDRIAGIKSPFVTEVELRALLTEVGLSENLLVNVALDQAIKSHKEQVREGGAPYLEEHIFPVTKSVIDHKIAAGESVTPELVAAALTHDVSEDDPDMPLPKLRELFAPLVQYSSDGMTNVADIVGPLTKPGIEEFPGETKAEKKIARDLAYFNGLYTGRPEVAIIKVADRENNMFCSHKLDDPHEILDYCDETIKSIVPLAEKVIPGMAVSIRDRIELLREVADYRISQEQA